MYQSNQMRAGTLAESQALTMLRFASIYLIFALTLVGVGQSTNPAGSNSGDKQTISSLEQQIQELRQHERELQQRIETLETTQKQSVHIEDGRTEPGQKVANEQSTATTSSPPAQSAAAPSPVQTGDQTAAAPEPTEIHNFHGIQWRGFGEVDYKILNQRIPELGTYGYVPGSSGSFFTGDFDLFLNSHLTDKTSVLAEIDLEEEDAQSFKVDLRRMLFKYDANDHMRFSFGRNQTDIGYYNWAFRSATWLQTTADRPFVMEFASDGGVLPTQAVGISVTGSIPSGKLGLNYVAEYGSSDTVRPDITGDGLLNDENNSNYVNAGFYITPDQFPGLRVGGSIYHDRISDLVEVESTGQELFGNQDGIVIPSPAARWNQTIINGHAVYVAHEIEFLNEGFVIRHDSIGIGETFHTPAFYSQLSRKFWKIRPFFRYQYINASKRNYIYDDVGLRYGPSFGARYDLNDYLALKAQVDRTARRGSPDFSGLHLQLSGTF